MSAHFKFRSTTRASAGQMNAALNEFSELLSTDMPLNDIAGKMDITRGSACVYLAELERRYGGGR